MTLWRSQTDLTMTHQMYTEETIDAHSDANCRTRCASLRAIRIAARNTHRCARCASVLAMRIEACRAWTCHSIRYVCSDSIQMQNLNPQQFTCIHCICRAYCGDMPQHWSAWRSMHRIDVHAPTTYACTWTIYGLGERHTKSKMRLNQKMISNLEFYHIRTLYLRTMHPRVEHAFRDSVFWVGRKWHVWLMSIWNDIAIIVYLRGHNTGTLLSNGDATFKRAVL